MTSLDSLDVMGSFLPNITLLHLVQVPTAFMQVFIYLFIYLFVVHFPL